MTGVEIICIVLGVLAVLGTPMLLFLHRRRDHQMMKSIEWQLEKSRRIADGWRPSLWDDDATSQEKQEALWKYLDGWKEK